jgi:hypothetical protein
MAIYRGTGSTGSGEPISIVDADNAAITGGTIDGTVIGGTTPAAGTFTTLNATAGTLSGLTLTLGSTWSSSNGLEALTSAEVDQLEAIGTSTISATQWGYLGGLDQALSTTDSVSFGTLDMSSGTLTLANDQLSGNVIDGGTISNFASTGIDDNATSTAITIDSNDNVGIGNSSLENWFGGLTALQLGGGASMAFDNDTTNTFVHLSQNYYYDGTDRYMHTAAAAQHSVYNGQHIFRVAASGTADTAISWTEALTISNSGNVGIGNSSFESWGTGNALQMGDRTSIFSRASNDNTYILTNGYLDTDNSTWKYQDSAGAALHLVGDGYHTFYIASSGTADTAITWTAALSITSSGVAQFGGHLDLPNVYSLRWSSGHRITGNTSGNLTSMYTNAREQLRVDHTTTAGETALLLYDVDNAAIQRVTVGAANSGGSGYKVLRIPN